MPKKIIQTPKAPFPVGPYSQAVLTQGTLYVSGQIPIDPESGDLISGDIAVETHQVMKNLLAVLEAANLNFSHVVKCTIFVTDMNHFTAVNQAYEQYFTSGPPARETVEVSRLPKDVNVEISCVAVAHDDLDLA